MTDYVQRIFDNLDSWRHLPSYQLERRADAFFSAYLPDILELRFGSKPAHLIPEFPIHIPTIHPGALGHRSFKVDYLGVFSADRPLVLVELKTEASSRRDKQDWYLSKAQDTGVRDLLTGLAKIYAATVAKSKYDALLGALDRAGLIRLRGRGVFDVLAPSIRPEILYITPAVQDGSISAIPFTEIADLIAKNADALSQRFAASLRTWALVPAGGLSPAA